MRFLRRLSKSVALTLCLVLVLSINSNAAGLTVHTAELSHMHTSQGGSCYTPVYHSHSGDTHNGGSCYATPVYHTHSGSSSTLGGCYTVTERYGGSCGGHVQIDWYCSVCGWAVGGNLGACGNSNCSNYGGTGKNGYESTTSHCSNSATCSNWNWQVRYTLGCGKDEQSIDSYQLSCTKDENHIDEYKLTCNRGASTVAVVEMYKERSDSSYTLGITTRSLGSGVSITSYNWSTGASTASVDVTANGVYSCQVVISDGGIPNSVTLQYSVTDYDTVKPSVTGVSNVNRLRGHANVEVTASDNFGVNGYMLTK